MQDFQNVDDSLLSFANITFFDEFDQISKSKRC